MDDGKIIKYIDICQDSDLPKEGWIHACLNCHLYTSKYVLYDIIEKDNIITEYRIILCNNCQRRFNNNRIMKKNIIRYINKTYEI